jgi:Zn ribbon nucleic-acid-binding protein
MKGEIKMNTKKHYNCLGCPQCASPLHDSLFLHELNSEIKTVKCDNCDFIGYRKGWELLTKQEENEYTKKSTVDYKNIGMVAEATY